MMKAMINKLLGEDTMVEQWPNRDSIEFTSLHGDETCNECGVSTDSEYCQLCEAHME